MQGASVYESVNLQAHCAMLFSSILNSNISLSANAGTIIITEQPKSQVAPH